MFALLFALAAARPAHSAVPAAEVCKRALAKRAGGEIATMDVASSSSTRKGQEISGRVTAYVGMGPPGPGQAAAHHLIRADYSFSCRVRGGHVRQARLNPLSG